MLGSPSACSSTTAALGVVNTASGQILALRTDPLTHSTLDAERLLDDYVSQLQGTAARSAAAEPGEVAASQAFRRGYDDPRRMLMNDVIQARAVTKVYDGGVNVAALRGVDLSVARGSFLSIMGPSGSGKSTLLNILGALELPTSGQVFFEGQDLHALSDEQRAILRRRRIGFVFQQFNLLPIFSAEENVALPLRLEGIASAEANRRAGESLDVVGMGARRHHLPSQMSGGEQQRVAIARALVTGPSLILADEPTGSLDSANGEHVIRILRKLVDEQQQTVVLVTHDVSVASRADRVVSVRDGLIESDIDPRSGIPAAAALQERAS